MSNGSPTKYLVLVGIWETSIRVARINHVIVPVAPHGDPEISLVFLFNVIFVVTDVLKAFSPMLATLAGIDTFAS